MASLEDLASDGEAMPLINERVASRSRIRQGDVVIIDEGRSLLSHPSLIILVTTGLERFALYGIMCNLSAFLGNHQSLALGLSSETIVLTVLLFSQLPFLFAFVGGTLADTRWGRYKVYFAALVLQLLGSLLLLLSALLEPAKVTGNVKSSAKHRFLQFLVFSGQVLLAVGIACSGGTEIPLGVDQYRNHGPDAAEQFFSRYYFVVNVAGTLSYTILSFVQVNYNFIAGLAPTCIAYIAAVLFLFLRRNRLAKIAPNPDSSTLHTVLAIVKHAWRMKANDGGERLSWEQRAMHGEGGFSQKEVQDARRLGGVLGVLLSLTVYMATKAQTTNEFVQQGELMMNPLYRTKGLQVPPSMFAAFNSFSIVIIIPLLNGCILPRITISNIQYNLNNLRRIGIGMIITIFSLYTAYMVEVYRRRAPEIHLVKKLSGENLTLSDMSIFYQIPQYSLSGLAEVFVFISALEFAYSRSPFSMRGFAIGLVYSVVGLGGLLSFTIGRISVVVDKCLRYEKNAPKYGCMHHFYILMMVFMWIGVAIFTIAAYSFREESPRTAALGSSKRKLFSRV